MPYLVGDLLKEIAAGGPVPSFPKSFIGPPKSEKEKDMEMLALKEEKSKASQGNQAAQVKTESEVHWVRQKWARYYEPNSIGEMKPNFSRMKLSQFVQYMDDAQAQARHKVAAATRHMGVS